MRIGALDLGVGNVSGSNLFNLLILGLDDVFYRQCPLMADAGASHSISIVAIVMMNALFLDRIAVHGDDQALCRGVGQRGIAAVYVVAVACRTCFSR